MAGTVLEQLVIPVTVEYLADDAVYKVSCPALQGCHAWGETLDEAMGAIAGNVKAMLDARRSSGDELPDLLQDVHDQTSLVLRVTAA
jgi:predicted RNase H-like HicB family nuclease